METIKKTAFVILLALLHPLVHPLDAKPNIQSLNPTGYSLEVAYDNAPFFSGDGMIYALPKGMSVKILAMSGITSVYCQLPDGSRGHLPDRYFGGNTMQLSAHLYHDDKSIRVQEGLYDIISMGSWKYDNTAGRYVFENDVYKLKHQQTGKIVSVPAGATGIKLNAPRYAYQGMVPEESIRRDVIILVENHEDIGNLIGRTMSDVESYIGNSKSFVGDALTEIGYACSYYRNVAYADGEDRKYGLAVYYDRNSVCVDAVWKTYGTGKLEKPQEYPTKIPTKAVKGAERVDCIALENRPSKKIPVYDTSVEPVIYGHDASFSLKNLSYRCFARDILVGENLLSALFSIFVFFGLFVFLYQFFLKHTAIGSNGLHITIIYIVGLFYIVSGIYGMWKFNIIEFIIGSLGALVIVYKLIDFIESRIIKCRCPHCHYYYGKVVNRIRKNGFQTFSRRTHKNSEVYSEIGELERLNDEQLKRWETIYRYELTTSDYGKYEGHVICPRCVAKWVYTYDVLEDQHTEVTGYSKRIREELWKMVPDE